MGRKKIFISDVHVGGGKQGDLEQKYTYAWDWLTDDETVNFKNFLYFLRTEYIDEIEEIILLGDLFDNWVIPYDITPLSIEAIIATPKNRPLVNELVKLSQIRPVYYVPGNHDMGATKAVMKAHFPQMIYCPEQYRSKAIVAEHGHRYALFNAPPSFSDNYFDIPLGFFISRIEATRKGLTNRGNRNYHTYLDDILEVLGPQKLPQSVFEAVLEETKLADDIDFVVRLDSGKIITINAEKVKERYKNIYEDWSDALISRRRAVLAELDRLGPVADKVCAKTKAKVCVFGHSHKVAIDKDTWFVDDRIYANSGFWCGAHCTFVAIEITPENEYCVDLVKWYGDEKMDKTKKLEILNHESVF